MIKTYNDIFQESRKKLKEAGVREYSLEARIILSAAAEKTREEFVRDAHLYVAPEYEAKIEDLISRRLDGEPVAYLTGEWEFYGMPLSINRSVLIPRTDSEVLVDATLELLSGRGNLRILDMCTGSGCIGLALAKHLPGCRFVLADVSAEALKLCRLNILQNRLTQSVTCVHADLNETPPMLLGTFDMIVCNPPYVPSAEIQELDRTVRDYEPALALDGGDDGLKFYRTLCAWRKSVRPGGFLAVECGVGQAGEVKRILMEGGFFYYKTVKDTLGIDRVVVSKAV